MIPSSVQEKVKRFDSALRLVERQGPDPLNAGETCLMIALERRKRNGAYERIGWVRPDLLGDGTMLLNKLHRNDVRQYGSGENAADAYDAADRHDEENRRRERRDEFEQIGKATFEHMQRRCGERVNNAGMPSVSK